MNLRAWIGPLVSLAVWLARIASSCLVVVALWTALCWLQPQAQAATLNIVSYGAVPDDAGDDRTAINNAITAASVLLFVGGALSEIIGIGGMANVAISSGRETSSPSKRLPQKLHQKGRAPARWA